VATIRTVLSLSATTDVAHDADAAVGPTGVLASPGATGLRDRPPCRRLRALLLDDRRLRLRRNRDGRRRLGLIARRGDDSPGRRARRQGRRAGRRLLGRTAGERLLQQRADALGAAVLYLVDVEADAAAGIALVQPVDPLLRFLEVRRLRRDDEQRVHPLDRDNAQDARQRALVRRSHRLVELGDDGLDVRACSVNRPTDMPPAN
jgi:hypothetical protein